LLTDTVVARGMGARRSLVSLSVPLIAVVLAVALFLPAFNYSYISPKTFTYHLAIQRGTNTTLTITNSTILLTIAYNESYGSISGTLMKNFFTASKESVYVSFAPTFCEVKPAPIPLGVTGFPRPLVQRAEPGGVRRRSLHVALHHFNRQRVVQGLRQEALGLTV